MTFGFSWRQCSLYCLLTILLCCSLSAVQAQVPFTVSGRVFRDIGLGNFDGVRDTNDPGVGGVRVTAYDATGTAVAFADSFDFDCRGNNDPAGSGCTGVNTPVRGSYTLSLPAGNYRLEFTTTTGTTPRGYQPGIFSDATPGSGTSVQFINVTGNITKQDFALEVVTDYCDKNPLLMLPCYVTGDPISATVGVPVDAAAEPSIASFHYLSRSTPSIVGGTTVHFPGDEKSLTENRATGTVWGMAYQRETSTLFAAAVLKRHAGLGPGNDGAGGNAIGQIYSLTLDNLGNPSPVVPFVNVFSDLGINVGEAVVQTNAVRGLVANALAPSFDVLAFSQIAKVGMGDLEMSDDGSHLWFTNLYDRRVYSIDITNPAAPIVDTPGGILIPPPPGGCNNGLARPWGLEFYLGDVYVGVVCTGEGNAGTTADISGHIYKISLGPDPSGYIFNFDLDYPRGNAWYEEGPPDIVWPAEWQPWRDDFTQFNTLVRPDPENGRGSAYPQAIISDLEFDVDGSIIIALMDRAGHQLGMYNYDTNPANPVSDLSGTIAGDILRACYDNGVYTLEANATCPGGSAATTGAGNGQGPADGAGNSGEYYYEENLDVGAPENVHQETVEGGLAFLVGSGEVALSVMDPESTFSGGVSWFSNNDGSEKNDITLFRDASGDSFTAGKTNGIGDIELGCPPAPIEIGNYVWEDTDRDGVQDPDETPLQGVVLDLYDRNNVLLDTAITDAQGRYLFSSAPGTPTNSFRYGIAGLTYLQTGYQVRVDLTQPVITNPNYRLTTPNTTPLPTNADIRDSDALPNAGNTLGTITFNTGPAGANNHTYDIGFYRPMSLGNRVWYDVGAGADFNDGQRSNAEDSLGVSGVLLNLYRDDNVDGAPDGGVIGTDTTDANGYYLFDDLREGGYVVQVAPINFTSGRPLFGYSSSTPTEDNPDTDIDRDDNGIEDVNYLTNGIFSGSVTLAYNTELTNEGTELSGNAAQDGPNSRGLSDPLDVNSNLTVDFGFYLIPPTPTPVPSSTPPVTPGTPAPTVTPNPFTPTPSGTGVTILKTASRVFAHPGQDVTWTITVQNTTSITATNVVVTDTIPSGLTINSQQVTQGTVVLNGLALTWNVGTLLPGQSATLVLSTLINPNITVPFRITNGAVLVLPPDVAAEIGTNTTTVSRAQVVSVTGLPATGELPWWGSGLHLLLIVAVLGVILIALGIGRRRRV